MHPKLSKSPITYVIAQLKYTSIEEIEKYIPKLQSEIRDLFPHCHEIEIPTIKFEEGILPSKHILRQWHFIDKTKETGIIISKQAITIHTSHYQQFKYLLDKFETVTTRFHAILKFDLFTRIGLRYVNLIEDGIDKLDKGLLGYQLNMKNINSKQFLTKSETTQYSQEGIIKIQATHIGDKQTIKGISNIFVPPDLADTARFLSFANCKEPNNEFLIFDLDHFNTNENDFHIKTILNTFERLHELIYQVFCEVIGTENLKNWS